MRILVDVLHPAHVHVYRWFLRAMQAAGHEALVVSRAKDVTIDLLEAFEIEHVVGSRAGRGWVSFGREWAARTMRVARLARRFRADVVTGCMGPTAAAAARLAGVPSVILYNNESARVANGIAQPLATAYVTSESFRGRVRGRHVTHPSFHELAYLHPDRFTPDPSALIEAGLAPDRPFAFVRFVALASTHDGSVTGFGDRAAFVRELASQLRVVISSEDPLAAELESMRLRVAPERLHDVLAYASVCVGESATLAAEAAVLGVPAVYVADSPRGYLSELEHRWHLVQNASSAVRAREAIASRPDRAEAASRREAMLACRTDLTEWLVRYFDARGWTQGAAWGRSNHA
jgi:predicted glycosyltransferase